MASKEQWENSWSRIQKEQPIYPIVSQAVVLGKYDAWKEYDNDMDVLGYQGADVLAEKLSATDLPKDSFVLDVGCGTGLVGLKIKNRGFTNIHGQDGSELMLNKAKEKAIYKQLICCFLGDGQQLQVDSGTYDAVVMAGGVGPGHFLIDTFDEMFRIIKTGGIFAHTCRESNLHSVQHSGLVDFFRQKVEEGIMEPILDEKYDHYYLHTDGTRIPGRVQIFRLLKCTT